MKPLEQNAMPDATDKYTIWIISPVHNNNKILLLIGGPPESSRGCWKNQSTQIPYSVNILKCASCADMSVLVKLITNIFQYLFWPFQLFVRWRFHCLKYKPCSDQREKYSHASFKNSASRMVYLVVVCFLLKVVDFRNEFEASCRNLSLCFLMVNTR